MRNNLLRIQAYGNSMYPFFKSGDTLLLKPTPINKLKINDFITFQNKDVFITHRVIYMPLQKNYIITKGDTNLHHDGKIKVSQIIGKVVKIERNGKIYTPDTLYHFQSFLYIQEIQRINNIFQKKHIDFVFLKGLPLHLFYEKEIPKRIYADCDILITRNQQTSVDSLLKKLGYVTYDDSLSKTHKLLKNKENAINYYKKVNGSLVTFDIHLEASFMMHQIGQLDALYPQSLIDQFSDDILAEKRWIKTDDKTFYPILSSTHISIYLALHLFHHNFQGYYRYEFINKVLQKEKADLKQVSHCLKIYKLQLFVLPTFLLLWKYYKSPKAKTIISILDVSKNNLKQIKKQTEAIDIFADDSRLEGGIKRFYLLFLYSPQNKLRKLTLFFSPLVIYSLIWVFMKKISTYQLSIKMYYRRLFYIN